MESPPLSLYSGYPWLCDADALRHSARTRTVTTSPGIALNDFPKIIAPYSDQHLWITLSKSSTRSNAHTFAQKPSRTLRTGFSCAHFLPQLRVRDARRAPFGGRMSVLMSRPTRVPFSLPFWEDNDAGCGRCSAELAVPPTMKPLYAPQISSRQVFARWDPPPVLSLPYFQQLSSPLLSLPPVRLRLSRHAALCLHPHRPFPPRFPSVFSSCLSLDTQTDRGRLQSPLHSRALCLCRFSRK